MLTIQFDEGKMDEKSGNSAINTLADQARATADRVAGSATDAITSAKTSIHDTINTVTERANAASQWASEKVDTAKQAPTELLEAGAEYIRARPYAAVGTALAIGYLIGKLR